LCEVWSAALVSGTSSDCEARLQCLDGEYRWFLFRTVPLHDGNGNVKKQYGMNTDIEDRRLAEEAVRESERKLSAACFEGVGESVDGHVAGVGLRRGIATRVVGRGTRPADCSLQQPIKSRNAVRLAKVHLPSKSAQSLRKNGVRFRLQVTCLGFSHDKAWKANLRFFDSGVLLVKFYVMAGEELHVVGSHLFGVVDVDGAASRLVLVVENSSILPAGRRS
jgi:hypothetical protein